MELAFGVCWLFDPIYRVWVCLARQGCIIAYILRLGTGGGVLKNGFPKKKSLFVCISIGGAMAMVAPSGDR